MNRLLRQMAMVLAITGLGGCVAGSGEGDGSSSAPDLRQAATGIAPGQGVVALAPQYDVERISINVPRSLAVSEANSFRPRADIVWRGEPYGDRHAQVEAILTEAMATGTATMTTGRKVDLDITLLRFHSLTERTRYTIGGMHAMRFALTVRDAASGAIIEGPRLVNADIAGSGGERAIAEERAGLTQRVVVTGQLARVIGIELSKSPPPTRTAAVAPATN